MNRTAPDRSRTTVGVVGAGNMGAALLKGLLRAERDEVGLLAWDKIEASLRRLPASERLVFAASLDDLAVRADVVLVVVKPKDAAEVLGEIAGRLGEDRVVISAMAGVTIESMRVLVGPGPALCRIMPNLGVELGVGAVALAAEPTMAEPGIAAITALLRPLGHVEVVPEDLLDVITAVSGSGPAFLALVMESLEDGAVAAGLSRTTARSLVREAALTTAGLLPGHSDSPSDVRLHLVAEGSLDPAALGVLQDRQVRSVFRQAVEAALERSRRLRDAGRSKDAGNGYRAL